MSRSAEPRETTRVLMVLDSLSVGGAEALIAEMATVASPTLTLSVASLGPRERGSEIIVRRLAKAGLQPTYLSVRRLLDPIGFVRMVRTLRSAPVDVVHAHLAYSAILVTLAARLAGKPVVATLHTSPQRNPKFGEWIKERIATRIPARLGRLVFVSQDAYDQYARAHGPARSTWRMIPNGVDVDQYRIQRHRRDVGRQVWAVVAAMRPDKNHADLIRAWTDVVAVHPEASLLVIGDGPTRGAIERAVEDAELGDSVQLLGHRDDVPAILPTLDGVVSASIDEALPTALIEAAACGLPLVAADAGGTREIVIDRVTGRLVPVRDVSALSAALAETIGDPTRAEAYGVAGRALVEEVYSIGNMVGHLDVLYWEVIDGAATVSVSRFLRVAVGS